VNVSEMENIIFFSAVISVYSGTAEVFIWLAFMCVCVCVCVRTRAPVCVVLEIYKCVLWLGRCFLFNFYVQEQQQV
jgi:hypothetical protein